MPEPPEVADPDPVVPTDEVAVRITGVGGTGVVGSTTLVELAALPKMVRGYEEIKLANVDAYRHRLTETLTRLKAPMT